MTREEDIQRLIEGVLETTPIFYDDANGGYDYSCQFCGNTLTVGGDATPTMRDIKHGVDCIYLIAMDLNTR